MSHAFFFQDKVADCNKKKKHKITKGVTLVRYFVVSTTIFFFFLVVQKEQGFRPTITTARVMTGTKGTGGGGGGGEEEEQCVNEYKGCSCIEQIAHQGLVSAHKGSLKANVCI